MVKYSLVALPVLLILQCPRTFSVTVTTSKHRVEVHENSNAVLSCEFKTEKDTNPRIEWKKKGKDVSYVYFEGKFRGPIKDRASIDGATLTLHAVTQKDSGVYRCEVSAPLDKVILGEINVTLHVLVPPHTPACEVPDAAPSGSAVELHCKDKLSVPAATYSWYKNNKALAVATDTSYSMDSKTGTLKFKSVSKADAGLYRCEASNGIGAPKSCAGQHMKITEFELNLTLVVAVAAGAALILLLCCLGICLCYRRGCCRRQHTKQRGRPRQNYSPPTDPKNYRHTQSFVI